jgi:Zn ribbon nucleic-acid-binding protein
MSLQLNTKTKESPTADGAVEYEAVECTRCGYDAPVDNAVMIIRPTYARYKSNVHGSEGMKIKHATDAPLGAFCPECAESIFGEVEPEPNYQKGLTEWVQKRERRFWLIFALHILGVVLSIVGVLTITMGPP